jgi:hypothetical protein
MVLPPGQPTPSSNGTALVNGDSGAANKQRTQGIFAKLASFLQTDERRVREKLYKSLSLGVERSATGGAEAGGTHESVYLCDTVSLANI